MTTSTKTTSFKNTQIKNISSKTSFIKAPFEALCLCVFLIAYCICYIITISDYGVTFDEALGELYAGDRYLRFFLTSDTDFLHIVDPHSTNKADLPIKSKQIPAYSDPLHPDFTQMAWYAKKHAEHQWGFGPTLSALGKHIFFTKLHLLDAIDAHHISLMFLAVILFISLYVFAYRVFGFWVALFSIVALSIHPRFLAHCHFNTKDIPSTVLFSLAIITFYFGLNRNLAKYILLSAFISGLALATKANALFLPLILYTWFLLVLLGRIFGKEKHIISGKILMSLYMYPFIGILVCLIAWPYLLSNFPNNIMNHAGFLADRGLEGPENWQMAPLAKVISTTPVLMLLLSLLGFFSLCYRFIKNKKERGALVLIMIWVIVPVLRVSVPLARDFDGIRHWIEYLVPLSILSGLGFSLIVSSISSIIKTLPVGNSAQIYSERLFAISLLAFVSHPTITWNIANNPYQIAYFNSLIGGLSGAQNYKFLGVQIEDTTDYWASSYRKGLEWLNKNAEPNSMLFVGVAEHIMTHVPKSWLRSDIEVKKMKDLNLATSQPHTAAIYLMYITRPNHYPKLENKILFQKFDSSIIPTYQISVDGGTILKILKVP